MMRVSESLQCQLRLLLLHGLLEDVLQRYLIRQRRRAQ